MKRGNARRTDLKRLMTTIKGASGKIFEHRLPAPGVLEIARRMKSQGIDRQTISACTDLPVKCIDKLLQGSV